MESAGASFDSPGVCRSRGTLAAPLQMAAAATEAAAAADRHPPPPAAGGCPGPRGRAGATQVVTGSAACSRITWTSACLTDCHASQQDIGGCSAASNLYHPGWSARREDTAAGILAYCRCCAGCVAHALCPPCAARVLRACMHWCGGHVALQMRAAATAAWSSARRLCCLAWPPAYVS